MKIFEHFHLDLNNLIKNNRFYINNTAFVVLTMSATMAYAMCHGAEVLHAHLIARIVRAPMAFFDTTPIGRVTNRLSKRGQRGHDDPDERALPHAHRLQHHLHSAHHVPQRLAGCPRRPLSRRCLYYNTGILVQGYR